MMINSDNNYLLSPITVKEYLAIEKIENSAERFKLSQTELATSFGTQKLTSKPYPVVNGLAIIPIHGMLVNRFNGFYNQYATGYEYIQSSLKDALSDDDIKGIVFDVNSGGGQCAGCFETADLVRESRSIKPTMALVNSSSYSAAYAIGSAASKMFVTRSGGVGSIGVVTMHTDVSEYYKKLGVKVQFIYSGDHKVDGNPYEPLDDKIKGSIQNQVNELRGDFVSLVAKNRNIDEKVVFDTQAATYTAKEALNIGLIDGIMSPQEALQAFIEEVSSFNNNGEVTMSNEATVASEEQTIDLESIKANARVEASVRIKGILTCEEADGRTELAEHLAFNTEMSGDDAKGILAAAPKVEAKQEQSNFLTAMDADGTVGVGVDSEASHDDSDDAVAKRILGA